MMRVSPLVAVAMTLLLLFSSQDTALAFAQRMATHPTTTYDVHQQSTLQKHRRQTLLRPTKLSMATASYNDDNNESFETLGVKALDSIRFCSQMCLASVFADVFVLFRDRDMWSKFFGPSSSLSWVDYVDVFDSVSLSVFAGGLWLISRLYADSFLDMHTKKMDRNHLLTLFRVMRWIWGVIAMNVAVVSVSRAAALPVEGAKGSWILLSNVSSKQSSLAVACVLGIGAIFVSKYCSKTALDELGAYRTKHGIDQKQQQRNAQRPNESLLRAAGYTAYRNQALCWMAFACVTVCELMKWTVSFDTAKLVGSIFSITDIVTPFAMTTLLIKLNKATIRAAIAQIIGDPNRKDGGTNDENIYHDLFVAQTGFYDNVAKTVRSATIFHLVPYIMAPAVPFLLKALEWISPSLFAKVVDVFGL